MINVAVGAAYLCVVVLQMNAHGYQVQYGV